MTTGQEAPQHQENQVKEKAPSALADITLAVRDIKSRLDEIIGEKVIESTRQLGYLADFDSALPTDWTTVRKDVTYSPSAVSLDRDRVVLSVRVKVRGRTYHGTADHRLPMLASVENTPRFSWVEVPVITATKSGEYDRFVPTAAGQLVLADLASKWASVVDESSDRVVEHLRNEAVSLVRANTQLAPLITARDLVRDAWQLLTK